MKFCSVRRARVWGLLTSFTLLVSGMTLASTSPASAATVPPILDRTSAMVTADALPTAQINGVVWDQAIVGDTVFAGGQFTSARPAGAAAGTSESPRSNLMSYSLSTGKMTSFAPVVNGTIKTMALSPDKKVLYIGGSFTAVDGKGRYRLAAFDTATGALVSTFAPIMGSDVYSIAATSTAVYAGGWFKSVNGVARTRLGAVSASNGATLGWAPTADNTPYSLAVSGDNTRVIVGGTFALLNGTSAPGIGSLSADTGTLQPFAANQTVKNYGNSAGIYSVHVSGSLVVATAFWYGGTGNFEGMFTADVTTGAIKSMLDCHGDTYDANVFGGAVYTVSHHHYCSNIGGFPDTDPRYRFSRSDASSLSPNGTVQTNGQSGYANFAGKPAAALYNWFPDMAAGTFTGQSQGPWTVESSGNYVVQGGEFPTVNGVKQQGLVRFAVPTVAPKKMGPQVSAAASTPTATATSATSVQLSWPSNWDRDDQTLSYAVYRSDKTTPLTTISGVSQFWNLPTRSYTDTTAAPGTTYSYTIKASDPSGNAVTSSPVSVTTPAAAQANQRTTTTTPTTPTTPKTTPKTPAKPAAGKVLASDDFGTGTKSGWAPAKPGGSWTLSKSSSFSAAKGTGLATLSAGGSATAGLSKTTGSDLSVSADLKVPAVPSKGALVYTLQSRRSGSSDYELSARLRADKSVQLVVTTSTAGKRSTLSTSTVKGLTYQAGSVLHLQLQTTSPSKGTGAVLNGRVWAGSKAPAKAQITSTTSGGPSTGAVGLGLAIDKSSTVKVAGKTTAAKLQLGIDNVKVATL